MWKNRQGENPEPVEKSQYRQEVLKKLENWTEETTNIVFDKTESSKKDNKKS